MPIHRLPSSILLGYELHQRLTQMLRRIDEELSGEFLDDPDQIGGSAESRALRHINRTVKKAAKKALWPASVMWHSQGQGGRYLHQLDDSHLQNIVGFLLRQENWGWVAVIKLEQQRRGAIPAPKTGISTSASPTNNPLPKPVKKKTDTKQPKPVTWNELFGGKPGGGVVGQPPTKGELQDYAAATDAAKYGYLEPLTDEEFADEFGIDPFAVQKPAKPKDVKPPPETPKTPNPSPRARRIWKLKKRDP